MTLNKVAKECPTCGANDADCLGAIIKNEESGERISYNIYKCLGPKHHQFLIKRKGDPTEQNLTEAFITSASIKLD